MGGVRDLFIPEKQSGSSADGPFGCLEDMILASEDATPQGVFCHGFLATSEQETFKEKANDVISARAKHCTVIVVSILPWFLFQNQAQNLCGSMKERFPQSARDGPVRGRGWTQHPPILRTLTPVERPPPPWWRGDRPSPGSRLAATRPTRPLP